jgi:oxygen-dependent protoporphyrinogen oxidase
VLVRCFIGGPSREAWAERDEAELAAVARRELAELMGIRATPVLTRVFRWPNAMPQYDVGHPDRVKKMRALCARQPGMLITGAAFEGVGVPDCVRQAHQAAAGVVSYLSQSRTFQAGGVR